MGNLLGPNYIQSTLSFIDSIDTCCFNCIDSFTVKLLVFTFFLFSKYSYSSWMQNVYMCIGTQRHIYQEQQQFIPRCRVTPSKKTLTFLIADNVHPSPLARWYTGPALYFWTPAKGLQSCEMSLIMF